ncbi:hypothetical protein [Paenibacillus sp. JCM 10914]
MRSFRALSGGLDILGEFLSRIGVTILPPQTAESTISSAALIVDIIF